MIDARLVLAEVLFEHNRLEAAEEQVVAALQFSSPGGTNDPTWAVEIDLIRVLIAQQRLDEALNRIGRLRQAEIRIRPHHHFLRRLNDIEIGCRIELDDLDGALHMARASAPSDIATLTLARLDLRSGRPDGVRTRLGTSASAAIATEIRRLVLMACAEVQQGQGGARHGNPSPGSGDRTTGGLRPSVPRGSTPDAALAARYRRCSSRRLHRRN